MKSSTMFSLALVTTLAMGTAAYAKGPGSGQSGAYASGTQTRAHTPGTGLATPPVPGQGPTAAGGRGIHTPGTGLTTPPVPATPTN